MLWAILFLASCGSEPDIPRDPTPAEPAGPVAGAPAPELTPPSEEIKAPPIEEEPETPKPRLVILPPEPVPAQPVTPPASPPPIPVVSEPPAKAPAAKDAVPEDKPGRRLPDSLRDLMHSVADNDMEESSRRLKKLPARGLAPQDALLADLMTSYVHWRLGEDDKAEDILGRVHEKIRGSRGMKIVKALLVEPRTMAYGVYTPHESRRYALKDTLWLYIEPDNLRQDETPDGFRLSLAVDFTLRDSRGNSVHDMEKVRGREFEQICNDGLKNKISMNRRRDVWYYFKIALPANINPGDYTMEIRMADLVADASKWTKSQVDFTVE